MKQSISKEHLRRIRKILKSKLNGGNVVSAINSRALSLIQYQAGNIRWSKDELRALDRKTRKLLMINKLFHLQADVDRLQYMSRDHKKPEVYLISVEDCVNIEVGSLYQYSPERLLMAIKSENI